MAFEDMVNADQGSYYETQQLELKLANRIKFDAWDGNPRQCKSCGRGIESVRLRLLNASQCSRCVHQRDLEDDDEYF